MQKQYGQRLVLQVDHAVFESEHCYALIGSNGSGKSTLLKILAGTEGASAGSIRVEGDATRDELRVGYMPQYSYIFGFSVFRNVAMALDSKTYSKQETKQRVHAALEAVGMLDMINERGNTLSGGEAQRIALARILVRDLDVLLLDEPTASMDVAGTLQVEEALSEYRKRTGCLMLVATHAPAQANRIATKALMLDAGRVAEQGGITNILLHPTSEAGRDFLSYWQV